MKKIYIYCSNRNETQQRNTKEIQRSVIRDSSEVLHPVPGYPVQETQESTAEGPEKAMKGACSISL